SARSVRTVQFHKGTLMERLGLHSTAELTRYAIENGLST
ncbi:MAG: LuxR C-terminal-related transcriptional regulator, partial [Bryobacteraceae bacterium]